MQFSLTTFPLDVQEFNLHLRPVTVLEIYWPVYVELLKLVDKGERPDISEVEKILEPTGIDLALLVWAHKNKFGGDVKQRWESGNDEWLSVLVSSLKELHKRLSHQCASSLKTLNGSVTADQCVYDHIRYAFDKDDCLSNYLTPAKRAAESGQSNTVLLNLINYFAESTKCQTLATEYHELNYIPNHDEHVLEDIRCGSLPLIDLSRRQTFPSRKY